jgi:ATP-grasp domain
LKPTALLATTYKWYPTARLAVALAKSGFQAEAICPPGHPMFKTSAVQERHHYNVFSPANSFAAAITATKPDLVIPGDDITVQHLHRLYETKLREESASSFICEVLERSLGAPESFPIVFSRTAFLDAAWEEGLRVPETTALSKVSELREFIRRVGLPVAIKANGTSGGEGVSIAHTPEDAEREFLRLQAPPLLLRALKRTVMNQNATLLGPSIRRKPFQMSAQKFIAGTEATSAVACWKGEVVASLHFEVVNKLDATGHATVVRRIESGEMDEVARKMVRRLKLSGLCGFDFMLESGTRNAYLIEINPRSTQVGHLALGPERNIPAALFAAVTGERAGDPPAITDKDTIALFPQEWLRDSGSAYLRTAYHDVPWDEPELIRACMRERKKPAPWRVEKSGARSLSTAGAPRA